MTPPRGHPVARSSRRRATIAREEANIATFRVDPAATKHEIRHAVESSSSRCKVERVRHDEPARQEEARRQADRYRKPAWKKAIVELAEGHTIEYFEGV